MTEIKIVSGAQTGVDRAALDAAIELGVAAGGWCPEGRKAEDGIIPDRYPVKVLPNSGYKQRTRQNVLDSDGTLILYFSHLSGGTEQTVALCIRERKHYVLIDADEIEISRAALKVLRFIEDRGVEVLNVAGPRASGEGRAYGYAKELILQFLIKFRCKQ